jgi:hypothetical protein
MAQNPQNAVAGGVCAFAPFAIENAQADKALLRQTPKGGPRDRQAISGHTR